MTRVADGLRSRRTAPAPEFERVRTRRGLAEISGDSASTERAHRDAARHPPSPCLETMRSGDYDLTRS